MAMSGLDRSRTLFLRHPGLDPGSITALKSWTPDQVRGDERAVRTAAHHPKTAGHNDWRYSTALNRAQIGRWSDARAASGLRWTPASTGSRSGVAKMRSSLATGRRL